MKILSFNKKVFPSYCGDIYLGIIMISPISPYFPVCYYPFHRQGINYIKPLESDNKPALC